MIQSEKEIQGTEATMKTIGNKLNAEQSDEWTLWKIIFVSEVICFC